MVTQVGVSWERGSESAERAPVRGYQDVSRTAVNDAGESSASKPRRRRLNSANSSRSENVAGDNPSCILLMMEQGPASQRIQHIFNVVRLVEASNKRIETPRRRATTTTKRN